MTNATRIWWEQQNSAVLRIQTTDIEVHQYLTNNNEFKLVGKGVNAEVWIHRAEFSSKNKAIEVLMNISQSFRDLNSIVCDVIENS